jgi:gamma-glutamyl:cysteine ligase YbdK (ATP-grasp superfamily)
MYRTLQVLGPEHEFSIIDEKLQPLPIVDKIIKDVHGRIVNTVDLGGFSFGKELQAHVAEFKANTPFDSPEVFEETMYKGVQSIFDFLDKRYEARLLGLGMHPSLQLNNVKVWSHRDRQIYAALSRIFNLNQHGWLNIQSFQLNLPFKNKQEAVRLINAIANILPFLPAIAASSPIYESKIGDYVDNRLHFYLKNQAEVPSISGDIVPEYVNSFEEYEKVTVRQYSKDLAKVNAPRCLLNKEWLNSRGAVIRFDRKAIEIRIMDEQECVKSDVALSCFIRSLLRGIMQQKEEEFEYLPHEVLVSNLRAVIKDGLDAPVQHPKGSTARQVCKHLHGIAEENALAEEKKYLRIVKRRIEEGNLSDLILKEVTKKVLKTDLNEAIFTVYSSLADCLEENRVYS